MAKQKSKEKAQEAVEQGSVQAEASQPESSEETKAHKGNKTFLALCNFKAGRGMAFAKGCVVTDPDPSWIKQGLVAEG